MRGRYVIAGVGHTAFGKLPDRDTISMNLEACRKALADAGVEKSRVDAVFVKQPTSKLEMLYGVKVAAALGLQPKVAGAWDQGGAANITQIAFACMMIEAGQCEVALVTFADNPRSGSRHAVTQAWGDDAPLGFFGVPAHYAMVAQRFMAETGTTHTQLGAVAVACRKHGASNPNAQLKQAISIDEYLASPWLVEPFRRADCCLISDGGAAVVVMSEAKARELKVAAPVAILGFGEGQTALDVVQRPDLTRSGAVAAGAAAFRMAGVGPRDIDLAQLYDCYTIVPLVTLEDYGFCKRGQAGAFAAEGGLQIGGALPLNTSGGLLSETGMPGMQLIIEAVRQLRGTAVNQVKNARKAVVANQGGIMHTHATLILGA
jgi:acetyl-CoA acetyltransferase